MPPKVRLVAWLISHRKIKTCDMVQRRQPSISLSPHLCVMCRNALERKALESMDHLLLHCPAASSLLFQLIKEKGLCWSIPVSCNVLLCEKFRFFGGKKRGVVLGRCAMMAIFWVLWVERNRMVFENMLSGHL